MPLTKEEVLAELDAMILALKTRSISKAYESLFSGYLDASRRLAALEIARAALAMATEDMRVEHVLVG